MRKEFSFDDIHRIGQGTAMLIGKNRPLQACTVEAALGEKNYENFIEDQLLDMQQKGCMPWLAGEVPSPIDLAEWAQCKVLGLSDSAILKDCINRQEWSISERIHYYRRADRSDGSYPFMDSPFVFNVAVDQGCAQIADFNPGSSSGGADFTIRIRDRAEIYAGLRKLHGDKTAGGVIDFNDQVQITKFLQSYAAYLERFDASVLSNTLVLGQKNTKPYKNAGVIIAKSISESRGQSVFILKDELYFTIDPKLLDQTMYVPAFSAKKDLHALRGALAKLATQAATRAGRLPDTIFNAVANHENYHVLDYIHRGCTRAQLCEVSLQARRYQNEEIVSAVAPVLIVHDAYHYGYGYELRASFAKKADPTITIDGHSIMADAVLCEDYEIAAVLRDNEAALRKGLHL